MKAEKLAADHWAYLEGLLQAHNVDETAVSAIGFHYRTSFVHGFKHGAGSMRKWILGLSIIAIIVFCFCLFLSGVCRAEEKVVDWSKYTVTGSGAASVWSPPVHSIIHSISFVDKDNKKIGTLYLEDPMRFEGKVDESAKTFFDHFVKTYGGCKQ